MFVCDAVFDGFKGIGTNDAVDSSGLRCEGQIPISAICSQRQFVEEQTAIFDQELVSGCGL